MTLSTEIRIALEMGTDPRSVIRSRLSPSKTGRGMSARRRARGIVDGMIARGEFGKQFNELNRFGY